MCCRTGHSSIAWKSCAGAAACASSTKPDSRYLNTVADEQQLTPKQTGLLSALDFWMYAAEAMYWAATKQNDPNMEAVSKAQAELEKIEQQIEQLQGAAGKNPEALKQLQTCTIASTRCAARCPAS